MRVYVAPRQDVMQASSEKSIFLAGGITDCSDWRADLIKMMEEYDKTYNFSRLILINPRRESYENIHYDSKYIGREQINWEFRTLKQADAIAFWFTKDTVQPISLFELGRWSMPTEVKVVVEEDGSLRLVRKSKPLFVGCDPDYPRAFDIQQQMLLIQPNLKIHNTLEGVANAMRAWAYNNEIFENR